ncbi:MAG: hypothetical protein BGN88_04000 [Clostridiales bacterium 43-6]|nr:MAG: hypothetical protein BGN88_04000 [Clostridiales bacterium 43-6]
MPEIIKCFRETLPTVRLIGKRYGNSDRDEYGGFGGKWGDWFKNGWFELLENHGASPDNGNSYLGVMRSVNDDFEYWVGMFFDENKEVPEGFSYVDIPAGDIATCYIYGYDNGELFGDEVHNKCLENVFQRGFVVQNTPWFFERYNCPRYTTPDENGKVILDYCVYIND